MKLADVSKQYAEEGTPMGTEDLKSCKISMPDDVKFIIERLEASGYPAYAVGGCVRDSLLGRAPADWDIATAALPTEVISAFKGKRVVPTGIKHGTVTLVLGKKNYEITTYRIDGKYSDGRRPDWVSFTDNIKEDLARRDFTINAMAYNGKDGLVDCFGGAADLKRRVIRCVGGADERFAEDYLRMIRAYRFSAVLNFDIDEDILKSVKANKKKLLDISAERIRTEFDKLFLTDSFGRIKAFFEDLGEVLFPELMRLKDIPQINRYHCYDAYNHTLQVIYNTEPNILMRLCALFHDMGKADTLRIDADGITHFYGHAAKSADIALKIMKRMKYDNALIAAVTTIVREHNFDAKKSRVELKYMIKRLGADTVRLLLEFAEADMKGKSKYAMERKLPRLKNSSDLLEEIIKLKEPCTIKSLALNGEEVMKILGIGAGKEVGAVLERLLDAVIYDPSNNTKEILTDMLSND